MLISSKGTYAIRAITDMAENDGLNNYVCISSIAERLNVSRKYLECIMTLLSKNKIIDVAYGKCGGYKLNKKPEEYSLFEILIITEDNLKPVPCPCIEGSNNCETMKNCATLETYKELHNLIIDFLKNKTISDLMSK